MPNSDFAAASVTLPLWMVASAAALFVCIGVLTLMRAGASIASALLRVAAVVVAVAAVGSWFNLASTSERAAERRALDQRLSDLNARAFAPGSALACLDAGGGDAIETACEKAVFASPQSVAAAVSYVSARLALLADATDFAHRTGSNYESALATLRLAIESDRYGLVAHVLSVRDSCTPLLCDSYVLLHDPDRVQANLRERLFDHYVERYAPEWAHAPAGNPLAEGTPGPATTAAVPPAGATGVPSKIDFPSAASIPPVSIMTTEPGMPSENKSEAKADTKSEAKAETKSETKPASKPTTAHHPPQHAASPPRPAARAATPASPPPQALGPPPSATAVAPH